MEDRLPMNRQSILEAHARQARRLIAATHRVGLGPAATLFLEELPT